MHEPGTSHYELLRAFVDDSVLERATKEAEARGYEAHEFGDSMVVWRVRRERVHTEERGNGDERGLEWKKTLAS
jgi:S-adenosylmethionine:tRNA ribosyltransferase-isomerase